MPTRSEARTRKDAIARCRVCGARVKRIGAPPGPGWFHCLGGCDLADYNCDCPTLARAKDRLAGE